MSTESDFLTAKEVAALLRVELRTVRRWVSLGRLTPLRVGRSVQFRRAEFLEAEIRSRDEATPPPRDPSMG